MARKPKTEEIKGVYILIMRLQSLALKYDKNEDLGKFHRELAIELGTPTNEGKTEASKLAKELLENARNSLNEYRKKGMKGAHKRWHPNEPFNENGEFQQGENEPF